MSWKTREGTGICKRMGEKKISTFGGKTRDESDFDGFNIMLKL
jgi:hypothetical protein